VVSAVAFAAGAYAGLSIAFAVFLLRSARPTSPAQWVGYVVAIAGWPVIMALAYSDRARDGTREGGDSLSGPGA